MRGAAPPHPGPATARAQCLRMVPAWGPEGQRKGPLGAPSRRPCRAVPGAHPPSSLAVSIIHFRSVRAGFCQHFCSLQPRVCSWPSVQKVFTASKGHGGPLIFPRFTPRQKHPGGCVANVQVQNLRRPQTLSIRDKSRFNPIFKNIRISDQKLQGEQNTEILRQDGTPVADFSRWARLPRAPGVLPRDGTGRPCREAPGPPRESPWFRATIGERGTRGMS